MRTVVVYQGRRNASSKADRTTFLIWKLVNSSGIGFEEIHYTDHDGASVDPGDYVEEGFQFAAPLAEGSSPEDS